MREIDPTTQAMTVGDAQENWSQVIGAVSRRQKRVLLENEGVPVAALVSPEDLERLRRYDAEREAAFGVLDRIADAFADVPADELEREVERAISEARADLRREREQASRSA
jgi:PHD/YefM family antitoxin component YafN of YafNO toxin-antitoxin module